MGNEFRNIPKEGIVQYKLKVEAGVMTRAGTEIGRSDSGVMHSVDASRSSLA